MHFNNFPQIFPFILNNFNSNMDDRMFTRPDVKGTVPIMYYVFNVIFSNSYLFISRPYSNNVEGFIYMEFADTPHNLSLVISHLMIDGPETMTSLV